MACTKSWWFPWCRRYIPATPVAATTTTYCNSSVRAWAIHFGQSPCRAAASGGDAPWDWVWRPSVCPCVRTKLNSRPNRLHEHLSVSIPYIILKFCGCSLRFGNGQRLHGLVAVAPATSNLAARQCKQYRILCITKSRASDCLLACCARQLVTTFPRSAGQPSQGHEFTPHTSLNHNIRWVSWGLATSWPPSSPPHRHLHMVQGRGFYV